MEEPKVSIVIPVYNGSDYLKYAIDCALNQTYNNIEVIVVNDGSEDSGKTEEIALSYGDRIRYYYKTNGGVSSALNYGISKMTGEYFSWLSHDDLYTIHKVENAVNLLKEHNMLGEKCVAFTSGYFIDIRGEKIRNFHKYFSSNIVYTGLEVVDIMTTKGTLNGCCMLIPKAAFSKVGGFNESLRYSQDALMWYNIFLSDYCLVSDEKESVMYRLHQNQASQKRRDLFEHDALEIAGLLAEPLSSADKDGTFLIKYIKRLTKYQCDAAIDFLYNYAAEKGHLTTENRLEINLCRFMGFFRYRIVKNIKKIIIIFRK